MSENMNGDCELDKATIVSLPEYERELKETGMEHLLLVLESVERESVLVF